jgi:peptidoglycan/LPS O-acetylase OafA/YrhL
MGTFRLLLAWLVVISHTHNYYDIFTIDCGNIAVSVFFFVSGYLMPLAFESNYQFSGLYRKVKNYALNRFLRIYPIYWSSLIFFLILKLLFGKNKTTIEYSSANIYVYIQNFLLFGLNQSKFWGRHLLFNNPAWSLDVELQYYILVPFLLAAWRQRRAITIIGLTIFSVLSVYLLAVPVSLADIDRSLLAWSCLFLLGFCYFQSVSLQSVLRNKLITALFVIASSVSAFFLKGGFRMVVLVAGIICVASHLLVLQKERRFGHFDSILGELSYPVYIFHFYIVGVNYTIYLKYFDKLNSPISQFSYLIIANIVLSTIIGYLAFMFISKPIEIFRTKHKRI